MISEVDASLVQTFTRFALSMAVGLAVGIERAINNRDTQKKTSPRDFMLVAMLAFISSLFYNDNPLAWTLSFVTVALFSVTTFALENVRHSSGMTTLLALPLTFLIASMPNFGLHFWTIATVVFVLLLLLDLKEHLHRFTGSLNRREVTDFALLIAIAISLTPLIPQDARLPIPLVDMKATDFQIIYHYVGLEKLWKVVVMVSLMSFTAHFITKYARGKNALVLATFFGGLVSSLATILMLLRNDKARTETVAGVVTEGLSKREIFLGFVAANTGSIVKDIAVLRLLVGEEKFSPFMLPLTVSLILFITISAYSFSSQEESRDVKITNRPLPLGFIFKFSGMLALLIAVMSMVTYYLGNEAIVPASYISGYVSSAAAISSVGAAMLDGSGLNTWLAGLGIIAALLGSISAKYIVVLKKLGLKDSVPFLMPIASLAVVSILALYVTVHS